MNVWQIIGIFIAGFLAAVLLRLRSERKDEEYAEIAREHQWKKTVEKHLDMGSCGEPLHKRVCRLEDKIKNLEEMIHPKE